MPEQQLHARPINPQRIVRDVIVIGGSAGAYKAIVTILSALPADLPAVLGVVVHRGAQSFSDWSISLGRNAVLSVREGKQGAPLENGCVYIAPRDQHMTFANGHVQIDSGPKEHFTRPAVDPLFESAAQEYGARVVGVVLSGGGRDGTLGLLAISDAGGLSLIQRPSEAEYASMPRHAATHDHVQASLLVEQIAEVLVAVAHGAEVSPRTARQGAQSQ